MFQAVISADLFSRAMYGQSTEETRYYLQGVYVEPAETGAILTATNGHMLVCAHDDAAHLEGAAIVSLSPQLTKAVRAKAPRNGVRFLIVDDKRAAVYEGPAPESAADLLELLSAPTAEIVAYQPHGSTIDGSFPDWRRVVPQPAPHEVQPISGGYDARLISTLGAALTAGTGAQPLRLVGCGRDPADAAVSPALVFGSEHRAFGVLMPLRFEDGRKSAPAWVRSQPPIAAE